MLEPQAMPLLLGQWIIYCILVGRLAFNPERTVEQLQGHPCHRHQLRPKPIANLAQSKRASKACSKLRARVHRDDQPSMRCELMFTVEITVILIGGISIDVELLVPEPC